MTLTFEDFQPGHFGSFGPRLISRDEIIAYAKEYDPQPMHLDEEAAKASMLKGLAGSGWHMCSLMMRMIYDGFLHDTTSLGSPGVTEMKWLMPFRPGDELTLDVEVLEARASQSRPSMGVVTFRCSTRNAKGQTVSDMTVPIMIGRRATAEQV
ncbi:MaoC family dehydratase [Tardiphaga sp.]|jgi:acyl dehydratase|uniref:MaoC family dehydratase n=1 Tax=Tardiphaga sp. TaxID=1926292 RepID=UPI0037D9B66D